MLNLRKKEEVQSPELMILAYWGRFPQLRQSRIGTKNWDSIVLTWNSMQEGTFFDFKSQYFEKWGGRKFTYLDFVKSVDRFVKAATDESVYPKNKKVFLTLGLLAFLYNTYNGQSMFLKYLEEEPKPIFRPQNDRFPELTEAIEQKFKEVNKVGADWRPEPRDVNFFILAGLRMKDFLAVRSKLLKPQYRNPSDKRIASWVVEAQKASSGEKAFPSAFLCSDIMYKDILPRWLANQGYTDE